MVVEVVAVVAAVVVAAVVVAARKEAKVEDILCVPCCPPTPALVSIS